MYLMLDIHMLQELLKLQLLLQELLILQYQLQVLLVLQHHQLELQKLQKLQHLVLVSLTLLHRPSSFLPLLLWLLFPLKLLLLLLNYLLM